MKNNDMSVYIMSKTEDAEWVCEFAAASCVGANPDPAGFKHLLKSAIASCHDSVLEHASFTFRILNISRVTLAQLTRHRIASFSVLSQRYTNVNGDDPVVLPDADYSESAKSAYDEYNRLIQSGESGENARYILPEGTKTSLVMTMNARELRHFFALRCCERAQWEIRQLANEMLTICKKHAPLLFENAGPSCVALGYCPEKRGCGKAPKLSDLKAAYEKETKKNDDE